MSDPVSIGSILRNPKLRTEVGGDFGIVDDVESHCAYCGQEYRGDGIWVPNMGKAYPCTDRCELHRSEAPKERPASTAGYSEAMANRWKSAVGKHSIFLAPDFDAYPRLVTVGTKIVRAQDFIASYTPPQNVIIVGGTGTQKSFIAYALCERLSYKNMNVRILPPGSFSEEMIESFEKSSFSLWVTNLKNAGVLLIDDLGQETVTERGATALFSVINGRYENRRPTIATTNFDGAHLVERFASHNAYQLIRRLGEGSIVVKTGATERSKIPF